MGPVLKSLLQREFTLKKNNNFGAVKKLFLFQNEKLIVIFLEMKSIDFMIYLDFKLMSLIFFKKPSPLL